MTLMLRWSAAILALCFVSGANAVCVDSNGIASIYGYTYGGTKCSTLEEAEQLMHGESGGTGSWPVMELSFAIPGNLDAPGPNGNSPALLDYRPHGAIATDVGVLTGPPAIIQPFYRIHVKDWPIRGDAQCVNPNCGPS